MILAQTLLHCPSPRADDATNHLKNNNHCSPIPHIEFLTGSQNAPQNSLGVPTLATNGNGNQNQNTSMLKLEHEASKLVLGQIISQNEEESR